MSQSEVLEHSGSVSKTSVKKLRFSSDVATSNVERNSKNNIEDALPRWTKLVPTLQQWCIMLAMVQMVSSSISFEQKPMMPLTVLVFSVLCTKEHDFPKLLLFLLGLL